MGAGGSKQCGGGGGGGGGDAGQSSASGSNLRRARRSRGSSVFGSSCIRLACRSGDSADSIQVPNHQNKEQTRNAIRGQKQKVSELNDENTQCCRKAGAERPFGFDTEELAGRSGGNMSDVQNLSSQPANHSGSFLSRFNLFPTSCSFRLGGATSDVSSVDNPSLANFTVSVTEGGIHEGIESLPAGRTNGCLNNSESSTCRNRQDNEYTRDMVRNGPSCDIRIPTLTNNVDIESFPPRPERRNGDREPIERNVRFSRSLSVGRLRDRVLRRSSASDTIVLPVRQDEQIINVIQSSCGIAHGAETSSPSLENNTVSQTALSVTPRSTARSDVLRIQDHEAEPSLPRETRYHDVLEHRSNFLERRRRIRSQVRALQRLGNRFENLSGHERSCIMSGHHRTGRCTCHVGTRVGNSNDESTTRGSISRIVMLAEALFEVLDEMHQQSVALSSQPSISSTGSIPAPSEVVESLPVKLHSKSQKHHSDDVAQCYVCLLEYDEGDKIRILPCHHEFHKTCIDKWLKEIHRVCPLCRGDICRAGTSHSEI